MVKTIKYLLLLFFASLIFSGCQSSSPTNNTPTGVNVSSNFSHTNTSQPRLQIASDDSSAIVTMENTSSEIIVKKDQTTYKNIAPNTDAVYKKIKNGIKEDIILYQKPIAPPVYKYALELDNLKPHFFQGQYYFFDQNGNSQLTIPKPYMFDNQNHQSQAVSITIDNNIITITPDYNWLIDPQRQYPITIDPSLVIPDSPIQEAIDKRTVSTKTYRLGNGKFASVATNEPVHYQDSTGNWQDIDTAIIPSSDPEYNYMNLANNYQTYFSTDGFGQKKAVKFQVKDAWMKFKINNASGPGQKNNAQGNKFTFDQIVKNGDNIMDADYTLEKNRLLEEVVLNKFQGYPQIAQEIELHNAVLRPDGKKINAYHTLTNELLWIIPEPVMYEVNLPENKSYDLHYQIDCTNPQCSTLILTKVIDPESKNWLSNPQRNYPLVIDTTAGPNNPTNAISDGSGYCNWADSSDAYTSNNYYAYCSSGASPPPDFSTSTTLKITNFGFSIPTNTTINGILTEIEASTNVNSVFLHASIIDSGGNYGSSRFISQLSATDTYYSLGGATDLWSSAWTAADINSSNFGIGAQLSYCSPGTCSLHKNSLISTPYGYKKISDLHIGDQVLSYNQKKGKIEIKKIENVIKLPISVDNNRYYYIYYQNKIIKATENHKFYVNGYYIRADKLKIGDKLLGTDLKPHSIEKIEIVKNTTDIVWDITVQDNHNFFVEQILTHNAPIVPFNSGKIDHARITVYYSSSMYFEGVKMEGIKID